VRKNCKRGFTRWSKEQTKAVTSQFSHWIENCEQRGLPGKKDIMEFLESNPQVKFDWTVVRNKVFNEKMAFAKRKKLVLDDLNDR
jgi:hypothetical protein